MTSSLNGEIKKIEENFDIIRHTFIRMPKGTVAPEKIYATLPSTKRGERVYLTGDPKGKYFGYGRTKHLVMRDIEVGLSLPFFRFSPYLYISIYYISEGR